MTVKTELFGVVMERGHVPDVLPPELAAIRPQLIAMRSRFMTTMANADGTISLSCNADEVHVVLAPCVALELLLKVDAHWTVWLGPEAHAQMRRNVGMGS